MRLILLLGLLLCAVVTSASAQGAPVIPPAPTDTIKLLTPTGAFVRSLIIPGWGQAKVGAYKRGGVFFGIQSASWYMLLKTLSRLGDAKEIEEQQIAFVTDSLNARAAQDTVFANQLKDPVFLQQQIDNNEGVKSRHSLVESREQQRQDWIAYTIFFTLASGVDAFVAAHLQDFPANITARPAADGAVHLKFSVPLQRKP